MEPTAGEPTAGEPKDWINKRPSERGRERLVLDYVAIETQAFHPF